MDNQDYYGAPVAAESDKTLGERLRELYEAEDFVTVMNIDTMDVTYQFSDPSTIVTFSDYPGHKDTLMKKPPRRLTLKPGETKLCPAYEADLFFENLIKQMATRKTHREIAEGKATAWQSSNWNDPTFQDKVLKDAFVGKEDVIGSFNQNQKAQPDERPGRTGEAKQGA